MRTRLLLLTTIVALLAASPAAAADKTQYYLSLGDSLAQGYQPIGGPWSPLGFPGYNQGYADQLLKLERGRYEQLRLVKLGCGGETTTTMIAGSPWCGVGFAAGSQLGAAESFLRAHRGEVAFVTLDIGGNDVLSPTGGGVAAIQANLPAILGALRAAAGPDVPIVGMSYYNPSFAEWFGDPGSLQDRVDALVAFNDLLEGIYAAAGDPVADVESAFSATDTTVVDGLPLDVLRVCQWTWLCVPPPHGPDLHPNAAGYAVIAQAFLRALTG
jgi:lysophospholipase L1-like esterase